MADEKTKAPHFQVSVSPHVRTRETTPRIMWTVNLALVPALVIGVVVFGLWALALVAVSVAAAVITEALIQRYMLKKPITIMDGSAVVTGLLVAFVLPPGTFWYVAVVASAFAIGVVKQVFGGLGCNIWNPALAGRAFVLLSFSTAMTTTWVAPRFTLDRVKSERPGVDATTRATPLTSVKRAKRRFSEEVADNPSLRPADPRQKLAQLYAKNRPPYADLLLGTCGGSLGETSAAAILLGGLALMVLGIIKWHVPIPFILTAALLGWALPQRVGDVYVWFGGDFVFHLLAGGLMLGAFFMATDLVTSPITKKGMVIFGIGCGALTALIRLYGGMPEGVCYSILLMNTARPLIDRYTRPRVFGAKS